jgi:hypothetical protein
MPIFDKKGFPLWNMPAPVCYVEHKKWRRHKKTGERIAEPVTIPVYRGTSASYARWVTASLRRQQRKAAEKQAIIDALKKTEEGDDA